MKNIKILLISLIFFLSMSCEKEDANLPIDCEGLIIGLIEMDAEAVKTEINKLTVDLKANISQGDELDHKENLNLLITRLNEQCGDIDVSLICHACIETFPEQSEILVTIDSLGNLIKRVIDIGIALKDNTLGYAGMHEYDGD